LFGVGNGGIVWFVHDTEAQIRTMESNARKGDFISMSDNSSVHPAPRGEGFHVKSTRSRAWLLSFGMPVIGIGLWGLLTCLANILDCSRRSFRKSKRSSVIRCFCFSSGFQRIQKQVGHNWPESHNLAGILPPVL
jgi:hypothetical protein